MPLKPNVPLKRWYGLGNINLMCLSNYGIEDTEHFCCSVHLLTFKDEIDLLVGVLLPWVPEPKNDKKEKKPKSDKNPFI